SAAFISLAPELTGAPRFTGSDHSELAEDIATILGAAGRDSVWHPITPAVTKSAAILPIDRMDMRPPRYAIMAAAGGTRSASTPSLCAARRGSSVPPGAAPGPARPPGRPPPPRP